MILERVVMAAMVVHIVLDRVRSRLKLARSG